MLRGHEDDPVPSALALRLMGAVHRIVLRGESPELAGQYPSAGGEPRNPWPAFLDTVRVNADPRAGSWTIRFRPTSPLAVPACSAAFSRSPGMSGRPPLDGSVRVVARAGCDAQPVDPRSQGGRLTLTAYVWADQVERLERLRAALTVAGGVAAPVERAHAGEWIDERRRASASRP